MAVKYLGKRYGISDVRNIIKTLNKNNVSAENLESSDEGGR